MAVKLCSSCCTLFEDVVQPYAVSPEVDQPGGLIAAVQTPALIRAVAFRRQVDAPVLDITAEYVKERKQFGVPVGSFQAIQHHLANMAVSVRKTEHLARQAVWAVGEDVPDAEPHDVLRIDPSVERDQIERGVITDTAAE